MGESLSLFAPQFNRSIKVEARDERLTGDAGALVLREVIERLGIMDWFVERLVDPRAPDKITHPMRELLTTAVVLLALGWRDQDDADALRHDPAMRLAVSERRGVKPLERREQVADRPLSKNPAEPDGLASQPTLSRLVTTVSEDGNRDVARRSLLEVASRRVRGLRGGHRIQRVTIDIDSLPVEVHGSQPGSEYNGHYHARIYHPLVATLGGLGDIIDVQLRHGAAHTAEGGLAFILPLLDQVEKSLCQVGTVRIDAGFPEDELLSALEQRGTPYVARIKNNAVLDKMAEPHLGRPPGRPPKEGRTWFHEESYQAGGWSRSRRVVLVVQERPGDLFLHHFWIITNSSVEQMPPKDLLELYRERGTAEGHMGELMNVLAPALSSNCRPRATYGGKPIRTVAIPVNPFKQNEATLLLNALAYNIMHTGRVLLEQATREGLGMMRFRERVLRVAARILVHGRRAVVVVTTSASDWWRQLWKRLAKFQGAPS